MCKSVAKTFCFAAKSTVKEVERIWEEREFYPRDLWLDRDLIVAEDSAIYSLHKEILQLTDLLVKIINLRTTVEVEGELKLEKVELVRAVMILMERMNSAPEKQCRQYINCCGEGRYY